MIRLPEGHNWREVNLDATHLDFVCDCGATFSVELEDGSEHYENGDGSHPDDE